ncbi:MAG: glycosyltransferase family 39 protein, partial [Thermoanaerobaculia bacterium]
MRTPRLDSLEYYEWARLLSTGDFVWPAAFPHGPGYPLFLGAFLAVFDHSLLAARIVQAAAGALSCWLIFLLARRFYAWKAALAAGLMAALYGPLILTDISILAEGLLILLILGSVWLTLSSEG